MTDSIDAGDYAQLVRAVKSTKTDDLVKQISAGEGGADGFIGRVFDEMTAAFVPAKAAGQNATVQWEIGTPEGTKTYRMTVADGTCAWDRGPADSPRSTIKLGLGDFLKLITNNLNPMTAFMTGKLKVTGDLFFMQSAMNWFDRPAV